MSHFKRSAKTPALLFLHVLILLSARSLHADETSATAAANATATATTTVVDEDPVTSRLTYPTPNANETHTLNGTAMPPLNATTTSYTHNHTDDTEVTNATYPVSNTIIKGHVINTSPTTKSATKTSEGGEGLLAFLVIFFLFAIGCLGALLFRLYKKSRSYSFDLSSSPFNDQASDSTPLKTVERETFHSKDTDDLPAIPSVVIDSADNQPAGPVANGNVEEGPGDPANTLDNGSSKSDIIGTLPDLAPSDPSECGSQTECLPEESTDVDTEQQPANENNNNITGVTKAPAGLVSREDNFMEISLS